MLKKIWLWILRPKGERIRSFAIQNYAQRIGVGTRQVMDENPKGVLRTECGTKIILDNGEEYSCHSWSNFEGAFYRRNK